MLGIAIWGPYYKRDGTSTIKTFLLIEIRHRQLQFWQRLADRDMAESNAWDKSDSGDEEMPVQREPESNSGDKGMQSKTEQSGSAPFIKSFQTQIE